MLRSTKCPCLARDFCEKKNRKMFTQPFIGQAPAKQRTVMWSTTAKTATCNPVCLALPNAIPTQTSNGKVDLPLHPAILENQRPARRSGATTRNVSALRMIHYSTGLSRKVGIVGASKRARSGVRRMIRKLPVLLCTGAWGWRCVFGIQAHVTQSLTQKTARHSTYRKPRSKC